MKLTELEQRLRERYVRVSLRRSRDDEDAVDVYSAWLSVVSDTFLVDPVDGPKHIAEGIADRLARALALIVEEER